MKKSKQKSRRFKRYIRKQLNKAKKDIENLEMKINLAEPLFYPRGEHNHNRALGIHHHNPEQLRGVHGSAWKVFGKEDSGIRIEKKM